MIRAALVLLLCFGAPVRAEEPAAAPPPFSDDPDADAARRHYERGLKAYDHADFETAIHEFELARSLKAAPAYDYNIGRCFERLERWSHAADAYTRYLAHEPNALNAAVANVRS